MLGAAGRWPSWEGTGLKALDGCTARGGATLGCAGAGVATGCKVLDERVLVADCAIAAPAMPSRPASNIALRNG